MLKIENVRINPNEFDFTKLEQIPIVSMLEQYVNVDNINFTTFMHNIGIDKQSYKNSNEYLKHTTKIIEALKNYITKNRNKNKATIFDPRISSALQDRYFDSKNLDKFSILSFDVSDYDEKTKQALFESVKNAPLRSFSSYVDYDGSVIKVYYNHKCLIFAKDRFHWCSSRDTISFYYNNNVSTIKIRNYNIMSLNLCYELAKTLVSLGKGNEEFTRFKPEVLLKYKNQQGALRNENLSNNFIKAKRIIELTNSENHIKFISKDKNKKYTPKTKDELKTLVMDKSIYLGDIDTSNITDMSELFLIRGIDGEIKNTRTDYSGIETWDVSKIKNTRTNFSGIETWDVSNVKNMKSMFYKCPNFDQNLSSWDTSNVTNMDCMFFGCHSFNQDISSWNVSNVTDMKGMFAHCHNFNQPLSSWNVSKVENMSEMFFDCTDFNQSLNSWNVSSVKDMSHMFFNCKNFNQDLSSWNVSNVENMKGMFFASENFNQPLSSWNVGNVTNMIEMLSWCKNFNQPLNSWNVSKVTDMFGMFSGCWHFNQPLDSWDVSNVTDMKDMFNNCKNFNQDISSWDVSNVTDMRWMFFGCEIFNQDLSSWDVSNVENMSEMFSWCKNFNQPLDEWDVSKVKDMSHMFYHCYKFDQNLSSWDTSKVENMDSMFEDAKITKEQAFSGELKAEKVANEKLEKTKQSYENTIAEMEKIAQETIEKLINDYEDEIEGFQGTIERLDKSNKELQKSLNDEKALNSEINAKNASLEQELKAKNDEIANLKQELEKINALNSELRSSYNDLAKSVAEIMKNQVNKTLQVNCDNKFNQPLFKYTPKTKSELKALVMDESINLGDIDTSNITDMSELFMIRDDDGNLVDNPKADFSGIEKWDVSNVTNMRDMFAVCSNFNQDLSSWDVSNVTNMSWMFSNCYNFNQPLSSWDTSNVENMSGMFYNCENFNQDLNFWNVSNVTNMDVMFEGAKITQEQAFKKQK